VTGPDGLGIDVGGVIIDLVREERGQDARATYAAARPVTGAFEAIGQLVQRRFGERAWLVSRCDEIDERLIVEWLTRQDFFTRTGIAAERVHFCRERHDKLGICRRLAITHFVDDRLEVLGHLVGVVPHLYWLPSRAVDPEQFNPVQDRVRRAAGWPAIVRELLAAPEAAR
jgi:hypothetical protein